jgi:hypothetical protein
MMLLTVVLVPLLGILLTFGLGLRPPWPLGILVFLLGGGGFLRIAYALMFEAGASKALSPGDETPIARHDLFASTPAASLPPLRDIPASEYAAPGTGRWRDTNDLEPASVTENTTRLLEKEED